MQIMKVSPCLLAVFALLGMVYPNVAARINQLKRKRQQASTYQKEVKVGTLAGHGNGWTGKCGETDAGSLERARCNLDLYEEAAKAANQTGVDILLLPEYGLTAGGMTAHTDIYPKVGEMHCGSTDPKRTQVGRLSCIAQKYKMALAANVITSQKFSTYITLIIYDPAGVVQAVYHKNLRFLPPEMWATSGGYNPTTVDLFGRKWGLAICYEGLHPNVPFWGNWDQFDAFAAQGANNVLWSVGNTAIGSVLTSQSRKIANRLHMNVFASMNKAIISGDTTALVSPEGADLPRGRSGVFDRNALDAMGYTDSPTIDVATV